MIKILHVINGADLGGISSMILNYYRHIDRKKFHFDFVYSVDEPLGYNGIELQKLGANFYYVPKKSEAFWSHVQGIKKILMDGNYDAIHVHSSITSYVALAVAKHCGITVRVAHAHNAVKSINGIKAKLNRAIGNALIRRYATVRLACSKDAAVYTFGANSINELNEKIIPNAITAESFAYSEKNREQKRQELGIEKDSFVMGTVGRMTKEKNQIVLIDIFKIIKDLIPCSKLLLVGDGDERQNIERYAIEKSVEKDVIFVGQRTDVAELLSVFDVFLMPSFYEGFPIAGLEAGANGLPIVLSDSITHELDFLNGVHFVSLKESSDKWAEVAMIAKQEGRDLNAVKRVNENGFGISSAAVEMEKIYAGGAIM